MNYITFTFKLIRYTGLPFIIRETIQRKKVTIIFFHDVDTRLDKKISILKKKYNIISLNQYILARKKKDLNSLPPRSLIITIDDGISNNYKLKEILIKYKIPVTVFLCAGIVGTNKYFWFSYDLKGYNHHKLKSISNYQRLEVLKSYGFEQDKEFDDRQALSNQEIEDLKGIVDFQSHTLYHPMLTQCSDEEAYEEIFLSKEILEKKYDLNVSVLAYPNGDYGEREIAMVKKAGYQYAMTIDPGYNDLKNDPFKLKRFSIGDGSDIDEVLVKASGIWAYLKLTLYSFKFKCFPTTERK